jgi:N-[(2S)-2-amino-2-carboxyethyl]-L-glutamate dehydrogenase
MLYLNTKDLEKIKLDWKSTINVIEEAVHLINSKDFDQPLKPYLAFNRQENRIIAMPARKGGNKQIAGIKWISSFPNNLKINKPRAHSVTLLNNADTGEPISVINTPLISGIRTASVSGLMILKYLEARPLDSIDIGIVGFGPIGQLHLSMVMDIIGHKVNNIYIYDYRDVNIEGIPLRTRKKLKIVDSWSEAYDYSDIFITATTSSKGYIDRRPKNSSLLLNVSLRDFSPKILDYTRSIIVDDWEEVCRANTDIEIFNQVKGLQKKDTNSLTDIVCNTFKLAQLPEHEAIMFHPMGMALFDVAIANEYYLKAIEQGVGVKLEN